MQKQTHLTAFILVLAFFTFHAGFSTAQSADKTEQQIIQLSKDKWQWMADKNVDKLSTLFDDKRNLFI